MGKGWLKRYPPAVLLVVFTLFLAWFYSSRATWLGDEGMLLASVKRIALGQVMYRDFFEFWPPLAPYLAAEGIRLLEAAQQFGLLEKFGPNPPLLFLPRLIFALNIFFASVFTYLFSKRIIHQRWLQLVPSVIFIVSVASSQVGFNHNWLALNIALLAVWLSLHHLRHKWLSLGFLAGLTTLTIQTQGLALLIWSGWAIKAVEGERGRRRKAICSFLLGLSLPTLTTVLYFFKQNALRDFIYATLIFPVSRYGQVNFASVPNQLLFSLFVFYAGYIGLLFIARKDRIRIRDQNRRGRSKVFFLVLSTAFTLPALFTPGPAHTAFVFPFVLPLVIGAAEEYLPKLFHYQQTPALKTRVCLILTAYALLLLSVDFATRLMPNFYTALTQLNTPLGTSAGTLYTYPWQAETVKDISQFLEKNTRVGEFVLAGPYSPFFYVTNNIRNPTRYTQLTPNYNTDWMFSEAITDLRQKKPHYIVFYPSENPFGFDENNPLSEYVLQKYRVVREYPPTYRPENKPVDGIYERIGNVKTKKPSGISS